MARLITFTFRKFECETCRESQFVCNMAGVEEAEIEGYEVAVTAGK